jgi:rubrerythrin
MVKQRLSREVESTAAKLGPRWEAFSEKTADLFSVWLERRSTFISNASGAVGEWLKQLKSKKENALPMAGEIVEPGTFECRSCKHRVEVQEKGVLTPCPVCQAEEFRAL